MGGLSVLIAEDHPLYRYALRELLERDGECCVVGTFADGESALAAIESVEPAVAILDVDLPGTDGLTVLRRLSPSLSTRVLFLSAYSRGDLVAEALACGAAGFLSKDASPEEIRAAIASVARGGTVLSPQVQADLARRFRSRDRQSSVVLAPREREILTMCADGTKRSDIGRALHLSPATVKADLGRIYEKLEVSGQVEAVAVAIRNDLIQNPVRETP